MTRIRESDGAEIGVWTTDNSGYHAAPRVAAWANGFMLTVSMNETIRFGTTPEDLQGGVDFTEVHMGAAVSGVDIEVVDDDTAVFAWQGGGRVKMMKVTYGPPQFWCGFRRMAPGCSLRAGAATQRCVFRSRSHHPYALIPSRLLVTGATIQQSGVLLRPGRGRVGTVMGRWRGALQLECGSVALVVAPGGDVQLAGPK